MELLHRQVSLQTQRRPDAIAVVHGSEQLSYGELDVMSSRIARALWQDGVRPADRVCLLLPKSPRAVATIVGVLKAGAICVPLDPDSPASRSANMILSCDTPWILASHTCGAVAERLFEQGGLSGQHRVGWIDGGNTPPIPKAFEWEDVLAQSADGVPSESSGQSTAYILFTSGSTGTPKGVVVTHASVAAFLAWAVPYFGIEPGDRLSSHPPLHFDLSLFDLFGALGAGAQLHVVPPELNLLPAGIVRFIREHELTQWFSVPAVLSLVAKFDLLSGVALPSLRRVLWCGEVLPTSTLRYWMSHLSSAQFTNLYGPTEATIASSFYTVPQCPASDTEVIPIGEPCAGEELLVLDDALQPVDVETTGDLYIGGVGLSPGYWRDSEQTAKAFVRDPRAGRAPHRLYRTGDLAQRRRDGLFSFAGRADTQIKSRGYRIELGEIEAALANQGGLVESAAVAIPTGGFDGLAICCAYVPLPTADVSPALLRARLANVLPSYMLPTRWKAMDRLPRNANGKVDRRQLETVFRAGDAA
jgi:amino acid adenylation domain-containing protein